MIDHLFYFILGLTGVVFIVTEGVLFWFMWRYDGKANKTPVKFTHGSHSWKSSGRSCPPPRCCSSPSIR